MEKTKKKAIYKTITWRVIASSTTFVLAMVFFKDDPNATKKAIGIAISETAIKMLFYYLHERFWQLKTSDENKKETSGELDEYFKIMTHTYKARGGNLVECRIKCKDGLLNRFVENENGTGVWLKFWDLKKIKRI